MALPSRRSSRTPGTPRIGWFTPADYGQCVLACVAVFLLLASPIVPYVFQTTNQLLLWTVILAVPLACIGITLNHWAAKR